MPPLWMPPMRLCSGRVLREVVPTNRERERNRNLATTLVSLAIGVMGIAFLGFAAALTFRGGGFGGVLIGLFVGFVGLAILASGFFFQLVPLRVDALAEEKREYDVRVREGGNGDREA